MNRFLQRVVDYLLDQYLSVLGIMIMISTISYLVIIYQLEAQESDAVLIRMAGLQSQIFQQTNFLLSQIAETDDVEKKQTIRSQILKNIGQFRDSHLSLVQGDRYIRKSGRLIHLSGKLSDNLRQLYFDPPANVDDKTLDYIKQVKSVLVLPNKEINHDNPRIRGLLSKNLNLLGEALEKVVSVIQKESELKMRRTMDLQHFMYGITLISFFIVGLIILQPLVTRLRESSNRLKKERDFSENLLNTSQALIIAIDTNGRIVNFNHFVEENTGWFLEEAKGLNFFDHFLLDGEREIMKVRFNEMMQSEHEIENEIETQLLIRSGESLHVIWHNTALRDPQTRQPTLFLATGIDITARKLTEQQLKHTLFEFEKISSRLQDEVDLAASLQKVMLPNPDIELPGLRGHVKLVTASEVGGDYYDYFQIGGIQSILLIGDVSGHGVAAGSMVSAAKAGISSLINKGISKPSEVLYSLNETMLATASQSLLMTMACINLDARTGKLTFANAGHVLPYHRRKQDRQWSMLESAGLPLGKSRDAEYASNEIEVEMDVGDRLFLFTDALVEEESPIGEAFGYDRLEHVLEQYGEAEPEALFEQLRAALSSHCGRNTFTDDLTFLIVNHTDRISKAVTADSETNDIIRMSDPFYRQGEHPIPHISRRYIVLFPERDFADLLLRLRQDGICRILPKNNTFYQQLGWTQLLNQHHHGLDDDLYNFIPINSGKRQLQLAHSDDTTFLLEEISAWLTEQNLLESDYIESLIVLLDELLENSLYGAPRDGQDNPYYTKGEPRELRANEEIRLDVAVSESTLGLMVTDNWGTLTPSIFLQHLSHAMEQGVTAGVGGGGLYMMWRLSDYLQIRVYPHRKTQVTLLWDLSKPLDFDLNAGFQFLYHNEQEEIVSQ